MRTSLYAWSLLCTVKALQRIFPAYMYAKMTLKDLEGAEDVVRKYISEDTPCTDENDILFMAAADLYLVNGKEKERMAVTEALQKYEQELEGYSEDMESDISFELPFE